MENKETRVAKSTTTKKTTKVAKKPTAKKTATKKTTKVTPKKVTTKVATPKTAPKKRMLKADMEKEIARLNKAITTHKNKITKLQGEVKAATEGSAFAEKLAATKKQVNTKAKTIREKNVLIKELQGDVKSLLLKLTESEAQLKTVQDGYESLVNDANAYAIENTQKTEELTAQIEKMNEDFAKAAEEADKAWQKDYDAVKEEAAQLQSDIEFLTKELDDCNATLTAHEENVSALNGQIEDKKKAIQELKNQRTAEIAAMAKKIESTSISTIIKQWGSVMRENNKSLPLVVMILVVAIVVAMAAVGVVSLLPETYQSWGGALSGTVALATLMMFSSALLGWTE